MVQRTHTWRPFILSKENTKLGQDKHLKYCQSLNPQFVEQNLENQFFAAYFFDQLSCCGYPRHSTAWFGALLYESKCLLLILGAFILFSWECTYETNSHQVSKRFSSCYKLTRHWRQQVIEQEVNIQYNCTMIFSIE